MRFSLEGMILFCVLYRVQLASTWESEWGELKERTEQRVYIRGWMDGKAPLSLVRCPLNEDAAADASNYYDIYECIRGWATARVCGMPRVYHWPPKSSQLASAQWAASLFSSRTVNNRNGLHTCSLSLVIIAFTIKIRHLPLDAAASRYFHGKMRAKRSDKNVEFFHLCSHRRTWETRGLSEPSLRENVFFFLLISHLELSIGFLARQKQMKTSAGFCSQKCFWWPQKFRKILQPSSHLSTVKSCGTKGKEKRAK